MKVPCGDSPYAEDVIFQEESNVFADHQRQENEVKQSGLDWTIIRPGAFIDGERTGQYRHGFPGTDQTSKLKIARADVADFILKQLTDDSYLYKTPSLSY